MTNSKSEKPNGNVSSNPKPRPQDAGVVGPQAAGIGVPVAARKRQLLISSRPVAGAVQPMSADALQAALESMEGVKVVKRLKPLGFGALAAGVGGSVGADIVVAETSLEQANALQASAPPNLIIEHNAMLKHANEMPDQLVLMRTSMEAGLTSQQSTSVDLHFQILSETGEPVPKATVVVYGRVFPAQGETDQQGQVSLSVFGGPPESIRALYVKPASNYWERYISRPALDISRVNIVQLAALSKTFANFPATGITGWGAKLMGIDQLGPQATGRGVKVAIIDSGCDNAHPQLRHVQAGIDLTNNRDGQTWTNDTVSHGTHCAGIISGRSDTVQGIRGIAPEAEVCAIKVFPGGRFDDLISALDECVARGVDVVNMSLGSDQPSEIVMRKIIEARQHGVACIVAAGNSGGPVQFPGNVPGVLTVSAIGKTNEFPADSNHAQTVLSELMSPAGLFPARFSCFGKEVAVCGPGVAIVSTVPGGGYAAWDGTSMAAPHITGIAALILAHHPAFQRFTARNEQRVDALFQILKTAAVPVVADPQRGGMGLPVVQGAPQPAANLAPQAAQPAAPIGQMAGGLGPQGYYYPAAQNEMMLNSMQVDALYSNPYIAQMLAQMRAAGMMH